MRFYKFLKVIIKAVFFSLFRVKVIGRENLDFEGKMIVYSNHRHALDPAFTHCLLDRMPRYMAKKEAFDNKFLAWVITKLGAFPVDREHTDLVSIKTAFKILNDGGILGIFPEGRRSTDGKMGEFLPGAAMIAVRSKSPMLPVYISRRIKPFCRTYIVIGKPFDIREKMQDVSAGNPEEIIDATKIIRDEIIKLKESLEAECPR